MAKSKPKLTLHTLRICVSVGIGLFLGIQFRLLSYTSNVYSNSITSSIQEELPLPMHKLNVTEIQANMRNLMKRSPLFLFGHTTGHSGSGTFQESMAQPGCPWDLSVDRFEYVVDGEKDWTFDKEGHDFNCEIIKSELVPHLLKAVKSKAMKYIQTHYDDKEDTNEIDEVENDEEEEDTNEIDEAENDDGEDTNEIDKVENDEEEDTNEIDEAENDNEEDTNEIDEAENDDEYEENVVSDTASIAELLNHADIETAAFIDLGHFHNTGRTLECLARHLGETSIFVHIRRNRYSIARSFTPNKEERLNKTDWRKVRRENRMAQQRFNLLNRSNDHNSTRVGHETYGSKVDIEQTSKSTPSNEEKEEDISINRFHRGLMTDDDSKSTHFRGKIFSRNGKEQAKFKIRRIKPSDANSELQPEQDTYQEESIPKRRNLFKERRKCRGTKCGKKGANAKETNIPLPQTPCIGQDIINGKNFSHPSVSICPRSTEGRGPVDLSIPSDDVWDSLTPFQQFLWYADEMEHRWYTLQKMFYNKYTISPEFRRHVPGGHGTPTFIEVTWDSKDELQEGVNWVREQLGCTPANFLTHEHPHVKHDHGTLNCSQFIWEDLEYRKKMKFSSKTTMILFPPHLPQHVDSPECIENGEELEMKIREYSKFHDIPYNPDQWLLPDDR